MLNLFGSEQAKNINWSRFQMSCHPLNLSPSMNFYNFSLSCIREVSLFDITLGSIIFCSVATRTPYLSFTFLRVMGFQIQQEKTLYERQPNLVNLVKPMIISVAIFLTGLAGLGISVSAYNP